MRYIRVQWLHSKPDLPVELYSELDEKRWELRKAEVFPNGSFGFAGPREATNTTMLGLEALPPLKRIAGDPEFRLTEIGKEEFEAIWNKAHRAGTTDAKRRGQRRDDASVAS